MITGWAEAHEMPAAQQARRTLAEVALPPSPAERAAAREEANGTSAQDTGGGADEAAFRARINGTPPRNVLAEAAVEPFRDRAALDDRKDAIKALKPLGLSHVITGGQSGCILDANMGILEPVPDLAQRNAMGRQYEFERSQCAADERNRYVRAAAAQLAERYRALGLAERRRSEPASVLTSGSERAGGPERTFGPLNLPWSQVGPWLAQGWRP